jgi:hypothetical protein
MVRGFKGLINTNDMILLTILVTLSLIGNAIAFDHIDKLSRSINGYDDTSIKARVDLLERRLQDEINRTESYYKEKIKLLDHRQKILMNENRTTQV